MPVYFLTSEQRASYGRYTTEPNTKDLAQYFYLDDSDYHRVMSRRGEHNCLGFAIQLTSLRYLGRFLDDCAEAPSNVVSTLARRLGISDESCLSLYTNQRQRLRHIEEICMHYGYREFTESFIGFRFTRWIYIHCWTGTDRPSVLFDRATTWLLAHKVILPGASILERFIARLRDRVDERLWKCLCRQFTEQQQIKMEGLLLVPEGSRRSWFEQLRASPTRNSGPSLVRALERLEKIRDYGIGLPIVSSVPQIRIAALARTCSGAEK